MARNKSVLPLPEAPWMQTHSPAPIDEVDRTDMASHELLNAQAGARP
jgi:hypothetical protein